MYFLKRAFILLLMSSLPAFGQDLTPDRLGRIRRILGVPPGTPISVARPLVLPGGRPLRVYLAMGFDGKTSHNFARWIQKWNKSEGKQFGELEVVSDISRSDIVVARYVIQSPFLNAPEGPQADPNVPAHSLRDYGLFIEGYILARDPAGFRLLRWYHDTGSARVFDTGTGNSKADNTAGPVVDSKGKADAKDSGDILRDELFKMMRARPRPGGG